MSGLSDRVKNMKFMRSGETSEPSKVDGNDVQPVSTMITDPSQWSLSTQQYKQVVTNNKVKVQSVGYGNINAFDDSDSDDEVDGTEKVVNPSTVKRTWGGDVTSAMETDATPLPQEEVNGFKKKQQKDLPQNLPRAERIQQDDINSFVSSDPTEFLTNMFPTKKRNHDESNQNNTKSKKNKKRKTKH